MLASRCPSPVHLRAFQLGDLPEVSVDEIADHLEQCTLCKSLAQKLDTESDAILAAISRKTIDSEQSSCTRVLTPIPGPQLSEPAAPGTAYAFLKPPALPDEIGRLGNYRVLRLLGKGGMAFVFQAEDVALRRPVALKVMKPDLYGDAEGWERFLREARIMAAIKHEHLVTVYQASQEGQVVYLAMELLQGESLGDRIGRTGPCSVPDILRLGREIASGLEIVHRNGLIHRDIKPDNIWLESPGERVKILDFGLARFVNDDSRLTQAGTVMGTPSFMAPEQARAETVDARSDLFSLGCVLYCLCTGRGPFYAENTMAALTMLAVQTPRPVHEVNSAVPLALSSLVTQLLAKEPNLRPASAATVIERLRRIEAGKVDSDTAILPRAVRNPESRRRWLRIAAAAAVLVLLACAAFHLAPALLGPGPESVDSQPTTTRPPPEEEFPVYAAIPGAVYLSDLKEIDALGWPMKGLLPPGPRFKEPDHWPPPKGRVRVCVNEKYSLHGIWTHQPRGGGGTSITYRLDKHFSTFWSQVSLNDGPPDSPPMTFSVWGDGKLLWRSKPVITQADTQTCDVPVQGVDKLTIEVTTEAEDAKGSHGVWIEPYLLK